MRRVLIGAALAFLVSCRPAGTPENVVAIDAGPFSFDASGMTGAPCATACAVLALMGCTAGGQPDCVDVLSHIDGARELRTPEGGALTCEAIAEANNAEEVNSLGVMCP
jgi:hypothetical protein